MKRKIKSNLLFIYTYKHNPQQLAEHLQREFTIGKLLSYHGVEDRSDYLFSEGFGCKQQDRLLYQLYEAGFSARVLCIMFSLNNPNAVHVKRCRIHKKLNERAETVESIKLPSSTEEIT